GHDEKRHGGCGGGQRDHDGRRHRWRGAAGHHDGVGRDEHGGDGHGGKRHGRLHHPGGGDAPQRRGGNGKSGDARRGQRQRDRDGGGEYSDHGQHDHGRGGLGGRVHHGDGRGERDGGGHGAWGHQSEEPEREALRR